MKDHDMVMTDEHLDYSSMTEVGRVEISYEGGKLRLYAEGFEFRDAQSCRQQSARAMAWARDVLTMAIARDKLAPGSELEIGAD